jgi:hypothetical protein
MFFAGLGLLVLATVLIILSLIFSKAKINKEDKHHALFWAGLIVGAAGFFILIKTFM